MKKDRKEKNQRIRIVSEILEGHRSFVSGARILGLCEQQMRNIVAKAVKDGIRDEDAANAFFPSFLTRFNREFCRKPSDPEPFWKDRIRKDILDIELCIHIRTTIGKNGSVPFRGGYLVLPARDTKGHLLNDYFFSPAEIILKDDGEILVRLHDGKVVTPKILSKRQKQS